MAPNQADVTYRDNARARVVTRFWIALLVGLFASWLWLFVITGIWGIAEFVTMHKVLSEPNDLIARLREDERAKWRGRVFGRAVVSALAAYASVVALSAIIKAIKMGITHLL